MSLLKSIHFERSAILAFGLTLLAGSLASFYGLQLAFIPALLLGLLTSIIHWLVLFGHHLGHAVAAASTGYPMRGVRLWWWLASSLYPADEPELPARIHLTRALGGPTASILLALVGFFMARLFLTQSPIVGLLALLVAFDSLLVFGVAALLPLGFTDGSTLLRWWPPNSTSE